MDAAEVMGVLEHFFNAEMSRIRPLKQSRRNLRPFMERFFQN
jgi:hypothetical protein